VHSRGARTTPRRSSDGLRPLRTSGSCESHVTRVTSCSDHAHGRGFLAEARRCTLHALARNAMTSGAPGHSGAASRCSCRPRPTTTEPRFHVCFGGQAELQHSPRPAPVTSRGSRGSLLQLVRARNRVMRDEHRARSIVAPVNAPRTCPKSLAERQLHGDLGHLLLRHDGRYDRDAVLHGWRRSMVDHRAANSPRSVGLGTPSRCEVTCDCVGLR
jgi:hypothetical protein